jgi:hypothetical protein
MRNGTKAFLTLAAVAMVALALTAASASAAVITKNTQASAYTVSDTDLLQSSLGSVVTVGNFSQYATGGGAVLRDGANPNTGNDFTYTSIPLNNATATYALDLAVSAAGYNISSIKTYGQWDEGRDRQDIAIEYSTVTDPATFISIASYRFEPASTTHSEVIVAPDGGNNFLATSVAELRFTFPNQENGGGYRELDVFGESAVPKPSTFLLAVLGRLHPTLSVATRTQS